MHDVFISYSHQDREAAGRFAEAFRAQGLEVWWDAGMRAGEAFDQVIEAALRDARAVVVLWSTASVASRWVRAEATLADRNRTLMPAMIEPCERPIMFELTHTAELSHWRGDADDPAWQGFVGDVRRLIGPRDPMTAAAAAAPIQAKPATPSRPTVLVLPFINMSGDSEQEYFSDGVSEDIITDLARVSALAVISRSAAFSLKGRTVSAAQLARDLGVTHILEGSIRKSGQRVRITATLSESAHDKQVWAERFDRTLDDIFAIQDEISRAIVQVLKVRLAPAEKHAIERRETGNAEAYELYLMARQFARSGSQRMKPLIQRVCRRVIELDPGFARAWAEIAFAQAEEAQRGAGDPDSDGGRAAAERAVALDPGLADAHAAMAEVTLRNGTEEWSSGAPMAMAHVEAALRLDPDNFDATLICAHIHLGQRRFAEAAKYFEKAIALDPEATRPVAMVVQTYLGLGDRRSLEAASRRLVVLCERRLASEPDHGEALGHMIGALVHLGEADRARAWARRALLLDPDNTRMLYNIACGLTNLGDHETVMDLLDQVSLKANAGWLSWMSTDNDLDPVRSHPRFQAMVARVRAQLGS